MNILIKLLFFFVLTSSTFLEGTEKPHRNYKDKKTQELEEDTGSEEEVSSNPQDFEFEIFAKEDILHYVNDPSASCSERAMRRFFHLMRLLASLHSKR